MEGLRRKANSMVGSCMAQMTDRITYSSVVIHETVCTALTMTGLFDLVIKAMDILNEYGSQQREILDKLRYKALEQC